jgi:hypothetical protein
MKGNYMKNNNHSPYATYNLNKVDAPKSSKKCEPSAKKIVGKSDLRGEKK